MNLFTPAEAAQNYIDLRVARIEWSFLKLFLLGLLAGFFIALGAMVTNMATFAIDNPSMTRLISGLLFPFGLGMVILLGAELFTGNCMMYLPAIARKITVIGMLRNWMIVLFGNTVAAIGLAFVGTTFGQLRSIELAEYTVKVALNKTSLPFAEAFILGVLCNMLVCLAILCSTSAKDTTGRILGAYLPISFFVICGFEHSIANLFYIPAGIFTKDYFQIEAAQLGWLSFFKNLIPVTLGNVLGGVLIGAIIWLVYLKKEGNNEKE